MSQFGPKGAPQLGGFEQRLKHINEHIAAVKTGALLDRAANAVARDSAATAMRTTIISAMRESA